MSKPKKRKSDLEDECFQPKNRFQEGNSFSDITLVVEDQKLHVHKSLLMLHSPVFEKMFTSDFKENTLSEIPLPGKKYSAMVNLLEQIYPGDGAHLLKDEILEDLLELADEYDVQQVFTNCVQYFHSQLGCNGCIFRYLSPKKYISMSGTLSTDSVLLYLGIVERYPQMHALRERLVSLASVIPAAEMEKYKNFLSIPATATRDALLLRDKGKRSF